MGKGRVGGVLWKRLADVVSSSSVRASQFVSSLLSFLSFLHTSSQLSCSLLSAFAPSVLSSRGHRDCFGHPLHRSTPPVEEQSVRQCPSVLPPGGVPFSGRGFSSFSVTSSLSSKPSLSATISNPSSLPHERRPVMPSTSTKYYNRPSFLASPPDYALPSWSDYGPSRDVYREHNGRDGTQGASSGAAMLAIAHANTRNNIPRSFGSVGARMYAAAHDQHARVPFPDPPTLADIQRMEPDLSPASMRRRASDVDDRPLPQELIDDAMGDEESDVSVSVLLPSVIHFNQP